MSRRWIRN